MMRRAALPGLIVGALAVSAPVAVAQAPDAQVVQIDTDTSVCGQVTVTLTNLDVGGYGFTWTVGPFDGGPAGDSGRIDVAAGATVTDTIALNEDSFTGRGFFTLGVAYGPNTHRQTFIDLGLIVTDCQPPTTVTPPPTTTTVTATAAATAPATSVPTSTAPLPTLPPGDDDEFEQVGEVPTGGIATGG